ncbi:GDSL-type esterase/lipase family protein [Chelatococcus reniformis]|uniref:GDSL-type esterase/lipase family protein n=1 Tax=Chelatococcus reniformis TaxID=1494448 RepID=UPI001669F780|nr:GDSL-type esterase/lipase family protein [Chelatococcus reniformis]
MLNRAVLACVLWASTSMWPLAARECSPEQVQIATTPAPPPNPLREARYQRTLSNLSSIVDAVAIGDSLIQHWPTKTAADSLSSQNLLNLGVGGDETQHVIWRMQADGLKEISPRNIVILAGTNNLSMGASACAISAGLRRILRLAQTTWPAGHLFVVELLPRGRDFSFRDADRQQINAQLRKDAAQVGASTLNIDDAITCGGQQPCPNFEGDRLHLSPAGYDILSRRLHDLALATVKQRT